MDSAQVAAVPRRIPVGLARLPLLLLGMAALASGVLAGLARLGVAVPAPAAGLAGVHGALMVGAFFGTVISLERAVALALPWVYLAPLAAASGGLLLIAGDGPRSAQAAFVFAAAVLTAAGLRVVRQQAAAFTITLAVASACWLTGNLVWWVTGAIPAAVPWWLAFLVLTIAGERLELTRFLPTRPSARRSFAAVAAVLVLGAAASAAWETAGFALLSTALTALALWLGRHDIARRTVRQAGLTRYVAVCLLSGYFWLGAAGLLGLAGGFAAAQPWRDAALHAVLLGFVFAMVFGHAPIIVPAVARIRIAWGPVFYVPLALLHLTLALRIAAGLADVPALRAAGALGNGLTLALFVAVLLSAALRGRASRSGGVDHGHEDPRPSGH